MTDQDITQRLLARGLPTALASYAPALEAHKLPQIVVHTTRADGLVPWVSKLCGVPYWPKGSDYPHDIEGQPMAMLLQFNFAELPPLPFYPRTGILQFFLSITPDDRPYPHDWGRRTDGAWTSDTDEEIAAFCDQRYFRMVYHPHVADDPALLHLQPPELPYGLLPMRREASVSFSFRDSYVQTSDYRFGRVFGVDFDQFEQDVVKGDWDVIMAYWAFVGRDIPILIGGYSRTEQGYDPRIIQRDEDWLVLLTIDTNPPNNVHMSWGSGGIANWWIRKDDLVRGDFSRVMYFCDSS